LLAGIVGDLHQAEVRARQRGGDCEANEGPGKEAHISPIVVGVWVPQDHPLTPPENVTTTIESNATHCAVAMIKRRINRIVSSPCGNEHGSASVLAALLLYSYIGGMLVA
jgi:hypothetical protein